MTNSNLIRHQNVSKTRVSIGSKNNYTSSYKQTVYSNDICRYILLGNLTKYVLTTKYYEIVKLEHLLSPRKGGPQTHLCPTRLKVGLGPVSPTSSPTPVM